MPSPSPRTPAEYVAHLPPERRAFVSAIRRTIRKSLPKGYAETVSWGMIAYGIPLSRYPHTYNGQPLCYAAVASQKNYVSVYLMAAYLNPARARALEDGFKAAGKKLDMGKSCLRFKTIDDVPLDVIADCIASAPVDIYVAEYEASRPKTARKR
jgi:hypothetical protein